MVDGLRLVDAVDRLSEQPLPARIAMMVAGILMIGVGSGFYMGAGMGAGPRDSLMLVLAQRTGTRIGVVRAALEIAVTVVGFALGGTVGIGTVAFALGVGRRSSSRSGSSSTRPLPTRLPTCRTRCDRR